MADRIRQRLLGDPERREFNLGRRPAQALVLHADRHPAHPLGAIGQPVEGRTDTEVVEQRQT